MKVCTYNHAGGGYSYKPHAIVVGLAILVAFFGGPQTTWTAHATFPGRNGAIAFSSLQGPCAGDIGLACDHDIFTVAPNGSGIQRVTQGPDLDFEPAWSPDGRRIAFVRLDPLLAHSDIFVIGSDGSGLTNLTNDYSVNEYVPAWSPKGDKIAFTRRDPSGQFELPGVSEMNLYVMNADGTDVEQLTDTPGIEGSPDWSPDGDLIVFAHSGEIASSAPSGPLELIRPDGSGRRLLPVPLGPASGPHWSPDGKRILYTAGPVAGRDLWVIRPDGRGAKNLTLDSYADDLFGVWSPDGNRIAFLSDRDGSYKLYSMRFDGTHVAKLIDIELDARDALDWGPRS